MKLCVKTIFFGFVSVALIAYPATSNIVCYYDSQSYWRENELAKVHPDDLVPALQSCNYLIYGYIGINGDNFQAESLDKKLDLDTGKNNFKNITGLKKLFPHLKILLSVGGFKDYKSPEKYLKLIRNEQHIDSFVTSAKNMIQYYGFDGIDLAWQFPLQKEENEYSIVGTIWDFMKRYTLFFFEDNKVEESKKGFTSLCTELGSLFKKENLTIFLTVLPHVKYRDYIDTDGIQKFVDYVHIMAFNYRTPERTMGQADFATPIYYAPGRDPEQNIQATVGWWKNNFPGERLILGITTRGRSWSLNYLSGVANKPPVKATGPGNPGKFLNMKGSLAYYETCIRVTDYEITDSSEKLTRVYDNSDSYLGVYAYRFAKGLFDKGLWVSYEDTVTIKEKALYAQKKNLGGIAIVDLSLDDFKGLCDGSKLKFPLLTFAKTYFETGKIATTIKTIQTSTLATTEPIESSIVNIPMVAEIPSATDISISMSGSFPPAVKRVVTFPSTTDITLTMVGTFPPTITKLDPIKDIFTEPVNPGELSGSTQKDVGSLLIDPRSGVDKLYNITAGTEKIGEVIDQISNSTNTKNIDVNIPIDAQSITGKLIKDNPFKNIEVSKSATDAIKELQKGIENNISPQNLTEISEKTNPLKVIEKVGEKLNPLNVIEKVNDKMNPQNVFEKINDKINPQNVIEKISDKVNIQNVIEKANNTVEPQKFENVLDHIRNKTRNAFNSSISDIPLTNLRNIASSNLNIPK